MIHVPRPGSRWIGAAILLVATTMQSACRLDLTDGAKAPARSVGQGRESVPLSTPPGITTVEVVRELYGSQPEYQWTRLGDAEGRTLFHFAKDEPNRSACEGACAEEFHPLHAPEKAASHGDWSVVSRADGSNQWAYQGKPLYTFAKEQVPGEVATNVMCSENQSAKAEGDLCLLLFEPLMPPEGWSVARYTPEATLALPPFVRTRRVATVLGQVLVDVNQATLYAFKGEVMKDHESCQEHLKPCVSTWLPFPAPAMAAAVGEFSAVTRTDGTRQWAFRGRPLYRYVDDRQPGDAEGEGQDPMWEVALLSRDFKPEDVTVHEVPGRGRALTTRDGVTLYTRHPFEFRWGGRNARDGFNNSYVKGKRLGTEGCDAACLEQWRPYLAGSDAQSSGFWEVISAPNGTRQWAYKGYALYTLSTESPGTVTASNKYEYVLGQNDRYSLAAAGVIEGEPAFGGGAGLFWHMANP